MISKALNLLLLAGVQAGIYPANHWDFSTELTADTADAFVKDNVDAGKTVALEPRKMFFLFSMFSCLTA